MTYIDLSLHGNTKDSLLKVIESIIRNDSKPYVRKVELPKGLINLAVSKEIVMDCTIDTSSVYSVWKNSALMEYPVSDFGANEIQNLPPVIACSINVDVTVNGYAKPIAINYEDWVDLLGED